jgi:plasmid stabilization system protein ParE
MEIKILWTDEAIGRLKDIFDYYSKVATVNIAQKLVNEIVDSSNILITHPEIGVQEELLKERKNKYRYLVCKNYKIIYWRKENVVFIATVFDMRRNPKKLKKGLK